MSKPTDRSQRIAELTARHVRDFYVGDPERALADFATDEIFHIYGDNALTGIWRGKREVDQLYRQGLQSLGLRLHLLGEPEVWASQNIGLAIVRLEVAVPTATAHWDRVILHRFDDHEKIYRSFIYDDNEQLFNLFAGLTAADRDRVATRMIQEPEPKESPARKRNREMFERRLARRERLYDKEYREQLHDDHTEDVRLHIYGDNSLTGLWTGKSQLASLLSDAVRSRSVFVDCVGEPRIWAGENLVAAMFRVRFESPERTGEWDHMTVARINDDGKITEMWYHDDDEDLWDHVASVLGHRPDRSVLQAV